MRAGDAAYYRSHHVSRTGFFGHFVSLFYFFCFRDIRGKENWELSKRKENLHIFNIPDIQCKAYNIMYLYLGEILGGKCRYTLAESS